MRQLHVHLLFLSTIAITIISACQKKAQISDSWPEHNELYAHDGSVFKVEKCRKDTVCFSLHTEYPEYPSFLSSGSLYWHDDTMFYKLWSGKHFDPFLVLGTKIGDTLYMVHDVSYKDFVLNDRLIEGSFELDVVKKDTLSVSDDRIHVFDIVRKTNADCRIILSEKKGIMGIWMVYPGSEEFGGLRTTTGLGWPSEGLHLFRY